MPKSRKRVSPRSRKVSRRAAIAACHISVVERKAAQPIVIPGGHRTQSLMTASERIEAVHFPLETLTHFSQMSPVQALATGTGKTISAGLILTDLLEKNIISRGLVVCPTAAGPQWAEEMSATFGIRAAFAEGRDLTGAIAHAAIPVVVTSFDAARVKFGTLQPGQFEMIILDDADCLRNLYNTRNPSETAKHVRHMLDSGVFQYIMLPAARPEQGRDWDLHTPAELSAVANISHNLFEMPGDSRTRFESKPRIRKTNPPAGGGFPTMFSEYVPHVAQDAAQLEFPENLFDLPQLPPSNAEPGTVEKLTAHLESVSAAAQLLLSQTMSSSLQSLEAQLEAMRAKCPEPQPIVFEDAPAVISEPEIAAEIEFKTCEITGALLPSAELVMSDESGLYFRKDEAVYSAESGKVGHQSEMVECSASHSMILRSESDQSAISGNTYSKSRLYPSEKYPDRFGIESEMIICSKTGRGLLMDEALQSAVSGQWIDRDLAFASPRSGRIALLEEFVACEETGVQLLPDECGICAITNKNVDKTLLGTSDLSSKTALLSQMEECAVTGKKALPSELETCEVSGKRVDPAEMETCAVSSKRAIRYEFVESDISGVHMLAEHAVFSPVSKRYCTPDESVFCSWRNAYLPKDEVSKCQLTGLRFSREYLNDAKEFRILRDLLDGKEPGTDGANLLGWQVYSIQGVFKKLKRARCAVSADGSMRAVVGELRTLFGFKVRYAGLIVAGKGAKQILGRVVVGKRQKTGWTAGE